ncbi:sterol carrier family protein [Actinomyces minihominis]|uniref:sterol carrier family protein n=1 Tax=Actinomyces minihominis TaxID=2002838 RepID=UPI000C074950|nr:sterol carrier family protein [Actinomyces minihominis]
MAVRRIGTDEGEAAWRSWRESAAGSTGAARPIIALAVRYTLQLITDLAPGGAVEVRVIPFGATQILEGANHRRGTPPAVVEMSAQTWLELATGLLTWQEAVDSGAVDASGVMADLGPLLPLLGRSYGN